MTAGYAAGSVAMLVGVILYWLSRAGDNPDSHALAVAIFRLPALLFFGSGLIFVIALFVFHRMHTK